MLNIVEVQQTGISSGTIVWEWNLKDHLIQDHDPGKENYGVVAHHPELVDINFARTGDPDWIHANVVDYNSLLDQIMVSTRRLSEIWIIDHSTTTDQAAGHTGGRSGMGGDILYRWGNPQTYRAGTSNDQKLMYPHLGEWIEFDKPGGGNALVFNNGGTGDGWSSVDEIALPITETGCYLKPSHGIAWGPETVYWAYSADGFYAPVVSGAQRLSNGNTLICNGTMGILFVTDPEGRVVWKYINPFFGCLLMGGWGKFPDANQIHMCSYYEPDYPGLAELGCSPEVQISPKENVVNRIFRIIASWITKFWKIL